MWGNLAGVTAGITFAGLILLLRKQKEGSPVESVILGNALTALLALPLLVRQTPTAQDWIWLVLNDRRRAGNHVGRHAGDAWRSDFVCKPLERLQRAFCSTFGWDISPGLLDVFECMLRVTT